MVNAVGHSISAKHSYQEMTEETPVEETYTICVED